MRGILAAMTLALVACGSSSEDEPSDAGAALHPDAGSDAGAVGPETSADGGVEDAAAPYVDARIDVNAALVGVDGGPGAGAQGGEADAGAGVLRPPDTMQINWKACAGGTRECGTMHVPLDYADPAGELLKLAVMRRRASGTRLGTLLMNPGGPGSSAVDFLGYFVDEQSSPLLERFDLVAFDPRGVGYSTRIDCHATLQQWVAADPSPDDEGEWQAIDAAAARFARDCETAHPTLLLHLATVAVARDMDRVRTALGEAKLNYLGFSYGTSIGARYLDLFPDQVGAMVLDAAVDLSLSALELALQQAKGFELALGRYFAWCQTGAGRCPWTQGAEPTQAFAALSAALDSQPISAPFSDRPLGPGEFLAAVTATLYGGEAGWSALSPALQKAVAGDGSALMNFADGHLQREPDGSYSNREEANQAVNCSDRPQATVAQLRAEAERFTREAPTFGLPALTSLLICAHWSVLGEDLSPPKGEGAPPIIVIGTTGDPATPYAWSQALARDLASAVLLTATGEGHTGYGRGHACIDAAVEAYLFEGKVPREHQCDEAALAGPSGRLLFAPSPRWARR